MCLGKSLVVAICVAAAIADDDAASLAAAY